MSFAEKHTVAITTATGGGATGYTPVVNGRISVIAYTKTDFATTADITVTTEDSGQAVWSETNSTASKTVYPVTAGDLTNGTASTITEVPIYAVGERIKIAVAQGGNTKSGSFLVVVV